MSSPNSRRRSEATFRHVFQNIGALSILRDNSVSPKFYVRSLPWTIFIMPKCQVEETAVSQLGIYLRCEGPDFSESDDWNCSVNGEIKLISQSTTTENLLRKITHTFTSKVDDWGYSNFISWAQLNESFLSDNSLTLEVKMKAEVPTGIKWLEEAMHRLQFPCSSKVCDDIGSLLESEIATDVTFNLTRDSSQIKAHRCILASRSPVFAAMLTSDMREGATGQVTIDDIGSKPFKILLKFIYKGALSSPFDVRMDKEIEGEEEVWKEVINAAEKYDFPQLKGYAAAALLEFCSPTNALELLKLIKRFDVPHTAEVLEKYISENLKQVLNQL